MYKVYTVCLAFRKLQAISGPLFNAFTAVIQIIIVFKTFRLLNVRTCKACIFYFLCATLYMYIKIIFHRVRCLARFAG